MKELKTFIYSIVGGVCIAIGGTVFLSVENKVIGAALFTVGLFTICTMGFNLFTGKVCYVPENNGRYALSLITIWVGNFIGTWVTAELLQLTRIAGISQRVTDMCTTKLDDSLLSVFILAVFCNILIYIGVDGYKNNPHDVGKYLALIFGIMVFILCGFEHCVANMFYISMAGLWSGKALIFLLVNTLGNAVGGMLLPLVKKLK